jgi:methylmalonyl-CoA epimerase
MVIARSILRPERPAPAPEETVEAPPVRETITPVLTLPPTPDELRRMNAPQKLHHVAVAVDSVDEALKFYRDTLGLTDITLLTLEDRGLKIGLVKAGVSEIELLEPTNPENTVSRFLDRRGPGLHHVCFEVDDVEASMRHFETRGAEFIDPVPRPGAVGLVSFMPPSVADGVLVELAQTSGYETEPEPTVAEDEALTPPDGAPLVITRPFPRGAGGYTRPGLMAAQPIAMATLSAPSGSVNLAAADGVDDDAATSEASAPAAVTDDAVGAGEAMPPATGEATVLTEPTATAGTPGLADVPALPSPAPTAEADKA